MMCSVKIFLSLHFPALAAAAVAVNDILNSRHHRWLLKWLKDRLRYKKSLERKKNEKSETEQAAQHHLESIKFRQGKELR